MARWGGGRTSGPVLPAGQLMGLGKITSGGGAGVGVGTGTPQQDLHRRWSVSLKEKSMARRY